MNDTPNLVLPYILAAQSQKHVTHNEAIRAIDAIVQLSVLDRTLATPPATPADGDRYLVAGSPTGAWAGQAGKIAAWQDGVWIFYTPKRGWIAWIANENAALAYNGTTWTTFSGGGVTSHAALTGLSADDHPQYLNNARGDARYTALNPTLLGVNATADATNRLAVGSAASLFNHPGTGGHQIKINKAAAADTASFLFQTGFSGRAELGTTGDDDFHFKVSANGTTFTEAILINRTTGAVTLPNTTLGTGTVSNVATGTGLTGGPITATGTIAMANMAATTLKGNSTAAAAAPADLSVAQVKTMLNLVGTNSGDQTIALSGDVAGSGTGAITATIANNAVSNAKLAQSPANTLKGNNTGAAANANDLTTAQVKTMLAISSADVAGLGALATAASVNLSTQATGTLQAAQAPAHTGDVTSAAGSVALAIANNAVTNAKAAQMAANTLKGNNTGATANANDLTVDLVNTMLPVFVASGAGSAKGLVPDPGTTAGTTRYLREDGTWFTPPGGGGGGTPGGASGQVQFNNAGVFGGVTLGGDATLNTGTGALTLANNAVTNAKAAQMAANTLKGNNTGAAANANDLTAAQVKSMLAIAPADLTGVGTGVATFLATPTSANLAAAITNETGSGALVFATSPTLVTPALGVATATRLTTAAGTATVAPLVMTSGANLTTPAAGAWEFNGSAPMFTPLASQRGIVPAAQTYRLNAPLAGGNDTTVQSVLGKGVTLSANTAYKFELQFGLDKTIGTTAHNFAFGFGGTAVIGVAGLTVMLPVSLTTQGPQPTNIYFTVTTVLQTYFGGIATATIRIPVYIVGTLTVTTAGTFIPQYQLSAAPGGAYSTLQGSSMTIYPIGSGAADTSVGSWA